MDILLTAPPGIEEISAAEIKRKLNIAPLIRPFSLKGYIMLNSLSEKRTKDLFSLRSIHNIFIFIQCKKFHSIDLKKIYQMVKKVDLSEYVEEKKTFRVTSKRIGTHPFTSIDIQRIAGKAIQENTNLKVDLKNFDIEFEVDVIENSCWIGVKLTKQALSKRAYKIAHHPAELNAAIAYAMVSQISIGRRFLDPMTGSGTIPIERFFFVKENNEEEEIIGADKSKKYINIAEKNAVSAKAKVSFFQLPINKMSLLGKFDAIAVDPPYGRRYKMKNLKTLYRDLIKHSFNALDENGVIVIITLQISLTKSLLKQFGFTITKTYRVEHGGLFPAIFYACKNFK